MAAANIALLASIWREHRSGVLRGGGDGLLGEAPIEVSDGGLVDAWQVPDLARRLGSGRLHLDERPVGPRGDRGGLLRFLLAATGSHLDPAATSLPAGPLAIAIDDDPDLPLSPVLRHALDTGEARAEALIDRGVASREQLVSLVVVGILAEVEGLEPRSAEVTPRERWGPPVAAYVEIEDEEEDWGEGAGGGWDDWEDDEATVVEELAPAVAAGVSAGVAAGGSDEESVEDPPTDVGGMAPAAGAARAAPALPPWSTAPTFDPLAEPEVLELHDELLGRAWQAVRDARLADARALLQQAADLLPGQVRPTLLAAWVDLQLGAADAGEVRRILAAAADEAEIDPVVSGLVEEIDVLLRS